jgi:hypothetical protein
MRVPERAMLVEVELADALVDDDAGAVADVSGTIVVEVAMADVVVVVGESGNATGRHQSNKGGRHHQSDGYGGVPSLLPPRAVENACPNSSPISKRPVPESPAQS